MAAARPSTTPVVSEHKFYHTTSTLRFNCTDTRQMPFRVSPILELTLRDRAQKKKKKYGDAPFAETLSRQCSCHQKGGITAHAGRLLRHSVVGEGRHSKLSTRRKKKTSTREREEARKVSSVLVVWPRRSNSSSSPKRITGRARRSQGIQ